MLGYPRLLSGDLRSFNVNRALFIQKHQSLLFPESNADQSWRNTDQVKRYYLNFPMYPFRTLCPRDMNLLHAKQNDFDGNSPLFPAHTQINFLFKKRRNNNFLNFMLPFTLPPGLGATTNELSLDQKNEACTYSVRTPAVIAQPAVLAAEGVAARPAVQAADAFVTRYLINRVNINVQDMYLQVNFLYKFINSL